MLKMKEGQKLEEKVEEGRKKKKIVDKKKKEADRKKEDEKQARNNKSVLEMMKHWNKLEEEKKAPRSGKIPQTNIIVRKTRGDQEASGSKVKKEEISSQEDPRNRKEDLTGSRKMAAGKIEYTIDRKIPRAGRNKEVKKTDDEVGGAGRQLTGYVDSQAVSGRIRKTGVSSVKDLISNFRSLENTAKTELNKNREQERVLEENLTDRNMEMNLLGGKEGILDTLLDSNQAGSLTRLPRKEVRHPDRVG